MAVGQLIRVDFESAECEPDQMMLHIAVPQGTVSAGTVVCLDPIVAKTLLRELRNIDENGELPDGDSVTIPVTLWAEKWLRVIDESIIC